MVHDVDIEVWVKCWMLCGGRSIFGLLCFCFEVYRPFAVFYEDVKYEMGRLTLLRRYEGQLLPEPGPCLSSYLVHQVTPISLRVSNISRVTAPRLWFRRQRGRLLDRIE